MCGIAGYIGKARMDRGTVDRCLGFMHRRGPDAAGIYEFSGCSGRNVCLLHTRLSIIDMDSRANQPFRSGTKVMVYNGELYNYVELRRHLECLGHAFRTESDTEVLLKIIEVYGPPGLDRCEGMWGFAVYDEKDGSLLLGRDRFGEKPLYLFREEGGVYFGSEPKFIFSFLQKRPGINYNHLYRFIVNGYQALYGKEDTFFRGIDRLAPASFLFLDGDGNEIQEKYWEPVFLPDDQMTYDEAVAGSREKLIRSVKLRLRADVPLAFCLSGGVDSNALAGIAKRMLGFDVHGFTIVNTDARYEEKDMVEHSVAELGIRHTAIPTETKDFIPRLRRLIRYHDSPVSTITYYAHWRLMESIAECGFKIAISGVGADELFSGYYDHHVAYLYHMYLEDRKRYKEALGEWMRYIKPVVRNPYLANPYLFIENPAMRDHIFMDAKGFAGYLTGKWSEPFFEDFFTGALLRNRMANELFSESVPVVLHEDDLNSMYYSVENRSPFLDRELFEFCSRIPTRHLVRDGMAKAVLRDSMKGIAPEKIMKSRRKVGFNAPIHSYLDVGDPAVKASLLDQSPIYEHVKKERIERLISKTDLNDGEEKFLFRFLSSKLFLDEFHA